VPWIQAEFVIEQGAGEQPHHKAVAARRCEDRDRDPAESGVQNRRRAQIVSRAADREQRAEASGQCPAVVAQQQRRQQQQQRAAAAAEEQI
jgi:hypothetical protein